MLPDDFDRYLTLLEHNPELFQILSYQNKLLQLAQKLLYLYFSCRKLKFEERAKLYLTHFHHSNNMQDDIFSNNRFLPLYKEYTDLMNVILYQKLWY